MSQHSMTTPVAGTVSGVALSENINAIAAALASCSSGPEEPGDAFPCMWWADTTAGVLKQRNAANSAWISRMSLTLAISSYMETVLAASNSAAARVLLSALSSSGGNLSGGLNDCRTTVASHATTADIWAALGNSINWTGTAATTTFPAAPQAGAKRRLHCAGASSFTHSATLDIVGNSSFAAAAGDIVDVEAITTTTFRLIPIRDSGMAAAEKVAILGGSKDLVITNDVTTPNSKITIAAGELILKDSSGNAIILTNISDTLDISLGVADKGLDAGTEAASTWYNVWVFSDGTNKRYRFSTSATAPTYPAGCTFAAWCGQILNDSGSNFIKYAQFGNEFRVPYTTVSTTLPLTTYATVSLAAVIPPTAKFAFGRLQTREVASSSTTYYFSPGNGDGLADQIKTLTVSGESSSTTNFFKTMLAEAQVMYFKRVGTAPATISIDILGGQY